MSDLREALKDAVSRGLSGIEGDEDAKPLDRAANGVLVVVEAYLREHDAQTRQRVEALPAGWSVARKTGGDSVDRKAVLEALGGSDE